METLHFCGGFGKAKGQNLSDRELLAISLAKKAYPEANVLLHTAESSWKNAPEHCTVKEYNDAFCKGWYDSDGKLLYTTKHGAHISDKVRLYALAEYGGLYLDTDVYVLHRLPFDYAYDSGKLCVTQQASYKTNRPITNAILACKPGNVAIHDQIERYQQHDTLGSWDYASCVELGKYALQNEDKVQVFGGYERYNGFGLVNPKRFSMGIDDATLNMLYGLVENAYCIHTFSCGKIQEKYTLLGELLGYLRGLI